MAITLPSKRTAIVDAPEVSNFSAKFIYNFFTVDENLNDSGTTPPDFIEHRPLQSFDNAFLDSRNFNRFTPRYVRFEWRPNPAGNRPDIGSAVSIAQNISKIHNEQTFITEDFTNIFFQDTGKDDKIAYFVRRAMDEAQKHSQVQGLESQSPLDMVKFLNQNTTQNIKGNFLADSFVNYERNGIRFLDEKREHDLTQTILTRIKNIRTRTQLNNKLISTLLKTAATNTINIFNDETQKIIPDADRIQQKAIAQKPSTMMAGSDYDFQILDIVNYRVVDPNSFNSTVQVAGYIIDKVEYTHSGRIKRSPIVVESPNAGSTADLKVKYGGKYGYSIRSVVYVEIASEDEDTNNVIAVSFLVCSQNSPEIVIECREAVPPPFVSDFNVEWDFQKDAPRLSWSFPPNSQRDIKYFQVFKRGSINEPFHLVKMFDFNDSQTPIKLPEVVDQVLVEKLASPKSYYLDTEFTKESKAIYTVCTIDAHGFTSNYSIQFECVFDKFRNKLIKKLISLGGAPKAYPNFFLQKDTFVDSIKTSGAKSLRIIFHPEYLSVVDRKGNDLGLLKTSQGSEYRLQMINVDLQEEQVVSIKLLDKRTATQKNT